MRLSGKVEELPNYQKVYATYQNEDWKPEIYNIWSFAKKTNEVEHFGNTEQRIVDNNYKSSNWTQNSIIRYMLYFFMGYIYSFKNINANRNAL